LVTEGRHLGYYRGARGGTWVARFRPPAGGAYRKRTLGKADDTEDADGVTVLDFAQAQEQARVWFDEQLAPTVASATSRYTVADAVKDYVEYLSAKSRRTADDTRRRLDHHLGKLKDKLVGELQQEEIERWHRGMVRSDAADPDAARRSKDSANRVLTMLKAALNKGYSDSRQRKARGLGSADAWREVKPFKNVGRPRTLALDAAQRQRLINATTGALRNLVIGMLYTGSRPAPGEIALARVRDLSADGGVLLIWSSKTRHRPVPLTREAAAWFKSVAAGKDPDDLLFPKDDGTAWGDSHPLKPMREAVATAKLPKGVTLYTLRHTFATEHILGGTDLIVLAGVMGTSVKMLEQHYAHVLAEHKRRIIERSGFSLPIRVPNVVPMQRRRGR